MEIVPLCGEQCVCDALNGNIGFLAAVAAAYENEEELMANYFQCQEEIADLTPKNSGG
jgi:hypothetical protein